MRALASGPDAAGEEVALLASLGADEALAAAVALIDGALRAGAGGDKDGRVGRGLVAAAIGGLAMRRRAPQPGATR